MEALRRRAEEGQEGIDELKTLCRGDDAIAAVRAHAALALATDDLDAHLPPMVDRLVHAELSVRAAAEQALLSLGGRARPFLARYAEHAHGMERELAQALLAQLPK